ncbi:MAG TPA: hypothetical protein VFI47_00140, partial [Acidimicrobiales bacterium]|nr:hypothetical protein [Acidimicrobiales bacterium]
RSFETWTHADDARRAIGRPMVPPPAASLLTMGHVACRLVPRMLDARGARHPGRLVRITFTDLGDAASWDVDLGLLDSARPAGDTAVDVAIAVDALSFCRGVSARLPEGGVAYRAQGDESLARAVIEALPALAML